MPVEAAGRLVAPDDATPLATRVGIATGLVVVGNLIGEWCESACNGDPRAETPEPSV